MERCVVLALVAVRLTLALTNDLSLTTTTQQTDDLEKRFAAFETKSKSNEQKYAALMSNILSKLALNSNGIHHVLTVVDILAFDLNSTRTDLANTQLQLKTVTRELEDLKLKYNTCSHDSTAMMLAVNNTRVEVSRMRKKTEVQLKTIEDSYNRLYSNISEIRDCSSKLNHIVTAFNSSKKILNRLSVTVKANEVAVTAARANLTKLGTDMSQVKANQVTSQSIETSMNTQIITLKNKINENSLKAGTAQSSANRAIAGLTSANKTLAFLSQQIQETTHQVATTKSLANKAIAELTATNTALALASKQIQANSHQVQTINTLANTKLTLVTQQAKNNKVKVDNLTRSMEMYNNNYYFRVSLLRDGTFPDGILHFRGSSNTQGYSPSTGKFTAPVSGTYIFWADVAVKDKGQTFIEIKKSSLTLVSKTAYSRSSNIISVWAVTFLRTGEQVAFFKKSVRVVTIFGRGQSVYGGALLHVG